MKLRKLKVDERVSNMFVTKLRKLKVDERISKMISKEKKRKNKFPFSISTMCDLGAGFSGLLQQSILVSLIDYFR